MARSAETRRSSRGCEVLHIPRSWRAGWGAWWRAWWRSSRRATQRSTLHVVTVTMEPSLVYLLDPFGRKCPSCHGGRCKCCCTSAPDAENCPATKQSRHTRTGTYSHRTAEALPSGQAPNVRSKRMQPSKRSPVICPQKTRFFDGFDSQKVLSALLPRSQIQIWP